MCFRVKINSLCVLKLPVVCVLKHSYTNFRVGRRGGEEEREEDREKEKRILFLICGQSVKSSLPNFWLFVI